MKKRIISLLLCLALLAGILPMGVFSAGAAAAAETAAETAAQTDVALTGDYTNPDTPYVVKSYSTLQTFFKSATAAGKTYYVKLGKDISYSHYERGTLETNGGNVQLDLAGYTISVEDSSNNSFTVIHGGNGTVTITDSKRYDTSSGFGHLVDGKIDYLYKLPDRSTAILSGDIIVKKGWFVNRSHSSDGKNINSVYTSSFYGTGISITNTPAKLTCTGGVFEADSPISLGMFDDGTVVNGTQLRVKGVAGVRMSVISTSDILPTITNVDMRNYSGNSRTVAFDVRFEDGFTQLHTSADAVAVWNKIVSNDVYAYLDDVLQARGDHGVIYNAASGLSGPAFQKSYVLTPLTAISQIDLTMDEPAAGKAMPYKASGNYLNGYDVSSYTSDTWSNGVQWTDGSVYANEYPVGSAFERGKSYAVFIKVVIAQKGFVFGDTDSVTATINGVNAMCYQSAENEFIVYHTYDFPKLTVSKAPLSVTVPRAGQSPDYSVSTPGKGYAVQTGYSVAASGIKNGVVWMHGNGSAMTAGEKFEYGKKYTVLIFISPLSDYQFADSAAMTAAINGNASSIIPYSSSSYGVYYTFDLSNLITDMAVTIPSTRAGEQVKWTASVPADVNYAIDTASSSNFNGNGVMWKIDNAYITAGKTRYFEEGVAYKVAVFLKAKDGYTFAATDDLSATVNGGAATVNRTSDTKATVTYTFTGSSIGMVSSVNLTITAPAVGKRPDYNPVISAGAGYESFTGHDGLLTKNGVKWCHRYDDGGTGVFVADSTVVFDAGEDYYVCVKLKPSEGCQFASTITAAINGQPCQVRAIQADYCELVLEFPTLEEASRETINTLAVTVPEPKAGDEFYYVASVPEGKGYAVEDYDSKSYRDGVAWSISDNYVPQGEYNTFAAGQTYTVVVSLVLTDQQKYEFLDKDSISATVNGHKASVQKWSDSNYGVSYTFTVPGTKVIDTIELTIPGPVAGTAVSYDAQVPEGAGYRLGNFNSGTMWKNNVAWKVGGKNGAYLDANVENTFIDGKDYYVWMEVELTDSDRYVFAEKDVLTATINGHAASAKVDSTRKNRCSVSYTFVAAQKVNRIDITIPEPKAGAKFSYSASVPEDAGYMVEDYDSAKKGWLDGVMWMDKSMTYIEVDDANTYEGGKKYSVAISVIPSSDAYSFVSAEDMIATVNGKTAEVEDYHDGTYGIYYTFTVPEGAGSALLGDVDGDGKVDIFDAASIQKSLAGKTGYVNYKTLSADDLQFRIADVDGDGKVDIYDVSLIQKWMAGNAAAQTYGIGDPI